MIYKILEELDRMYNMVDDPRYKGEAPECMYLSDQVLEEFKKMSGEEIKSILDSRTDNQLEQLLYPMEEISDKHEFVIPYIERVMEQVRLQWKEILAKQELRRKSSQSANQQDIS